MTKPSKVVKLALALLDDDFGIMEAGYAILQEMLQAQDGDEANAILDAVDACDGRYYLPDAFMDKCRRCRTKDHDTCSMTKGCSCCKSTEMACP
jgi:hypothetical protein